MRQVIAAARARRHVPARVPILARLAPHLAGLPPGPRDELFQAALDAVTNSPEPADSAVDWSKAQLTEALAALLPATVLPSALDLVLTIGDRNQRARGLAALAPRLPPPLRDRALSAARVMEPGAQGPHGDHHYQAMALAGLARYVTEPSPDVIFDEALATAHAIRWPGARAQTLAALLPYLPAGHVLPAVQETLAALPELASAQARADVLGSVAAALPGSPLRDRVARDLPGPPAALSPPACGVPAAPWCRGPAARRARPGTRRPRASARACRRAPAAGRVSAGRRTRRPGSGAPTAR
jgi:hypothetical protein